MKDLRHAESGLGSATGGTATPPVVAEQSAQPLVIYCSDFEPVRVDVALGRELLDAFARSMELSTAGGDRELAD